MFFLIIPYKEICRKRERPFCLADSNTVPNEVYDYTKSSLISERLYNRHDLTFSGPTPNIQVA
jgi:hypothetical protein